MVHPNDQEAQVNRRFIVEFLTASTEEHIRCRLTVERDKDYEVTDDDWAAAAAILLNGAARNMSIGFEKAIEDITSMAFRQRHIR